MKDVELMNEAIVRRRAFYMERDPHDNIGLDSETEIKDEGLDGYVMYAEDTYNFTKKEDRKDMLMRILDGIWRAENKDPGSPSDFLKEAAQCARKFEERESEEGRK